MATASKDRLLTFTFFVTRTITILLLLVAVAMIVAGALITFDIGTGGDALRSQYSGADFAAYKAQLGLLLPMALIGIGFAAAFFHLLTQIVRSVSEGDPFLPVNAKRLQNMGWLALAFQLISIPVVMVDTRMGEIAGETGRMDVDIGGFVLALTLFVLARVFAHGAAMRDDLEGTV